MSLPAGSRVVLLSTLLAAGATVHAQQPEPDGFRFHGYLRSGFGVADEGKPQEAFRAPNTLAKYRLGNETEAYVETTFAYGVRPEDDPRSFFDTRITVSYVTPTSNTNSFATTTALREAFVLAQGVWQRQEGATFWAGQRYYDRHDLHMSDFYYRDLSGFGGGLEGVRIGGKRRLAFAWLGGSVNELTSSGTVPPPGSFQLSKNTFDLRLYELSLLGGRTQVALDYGYFAGDTLAFAEGSVSVRSNSGWAAALTHERPVGSGRNKLTAQYGTGIAADFRAVVTPIPGRRFGVGETVDYADVWQWRLVEDLQLDHAGPFTLQLGAIWQGARERATTGNRLSWYSLGLRPAYHFDQHFSLELEAGYDHSEQSDVLSGSLLKLTLAPQITPKIAALSRPSLRAYVTWARWSDGFVGLIAPIRYGDQSHGLAAGVQIGDLVVSPGLPA